MSHRQNLCQVSILFPNIFMFTLVSFFHVTHSTNCCFSAYPWPFTIPSRGRVGDKRSKAAFLLGMQWGVMEEWKRTPAWPRIRQNLCPAMWILFSFLLPPHWTHWPGSQNSALCGCASLDACAGLSSSPFPLLRSHGAGSPSRHYWAEGSPAGLNMVGTFSSHPLLYYSPLFPRCKG